MRNRRREKKEQRGGEKNRKKRKRKRKKRTKRRREEEEDEEKMIMKLAMPDLFIYFVYIYTFLGTNLETCLFPGSYPRNLFWVQSMNPKCFWVIESRNKCHDCRKKFSCSNSNLFLFCFLTYLYVGGMSENSVKFLS